MRNRAAEKERRSEEEICFPRSYLRAIKSTFRHRGETDVAAPDEAASGVVEF